MSMLKKLKGIFIEEIDEPKSVPKPSSKATSEPTKSKAASKSSESTNTTAKSSASVKSGKPKEKFVNMLLTAIEENDLDGFDYLEFKQSVKSLGSVELDEAKKYQSAFAMASGMGLSKDKLFKSAQHYADVLGNEEKKFMEAFEKQRATQINERENRSALLEKSIKAKQEQIQKLQKEIDAEKKKLASAESDIKKAVAKIEATKESFYGSYRMVLDQIKGDIEKFNQYLS